MAKALSEMTLEELWQLFPIFLTEHQKIWKTWYAEEEKHLQTILPASIKMYHIGSTSITGIWAKPIIDILVEAGPNPFNTLKVQLIAGGYVCMAEEEHRIDFNKGYTPEGFAEKVFHLHLRQSGDHDELYFRDYLNEHPDVAKQYEQMKLALWKTYEHDRNAYTESKTEFIQRYTMLAKQAYGNRY